MSSNLKTHCKRGHPFNEVNTRIVEGQRTCNKCVSDKEMARARYHIMGKCKCKDKAKCAEENRIHYTVNTNVRPVRDFPWRFISKISSTTNDEHADPKAIRRQCQYIK